MVTKINKDVIKSKGVSLDYLGQKLGEKRKTEKPITRSAVSQLINGNPTIKILGEMAEVLDLTASDLIVEDTYIKGYIEFGGNVYKVATLSGLEGIIVKYKAHVKKVEEEKKLKEQKQSHHED